MSGLDSKPVIIFTGGSKKTGDVKNFDLLADSGGGVSTVGTLRASLEDFMPALAAIIEEVKAKAKDMGLQEVSVALGVNAKGKVGFLGTGAEAGGSATLTLKCKVG